MENLEEVFDGAIELALSEDEERKAIELSFDTASEREAVRIKLYKQKQLLGKQFPEVAKKLGIKSITNPTLKIFKVQLFKVAPLKVEIVNLD